MQLPRTITNRLQGLDDDIKLAEQRVRVTEHTLAQQLEYVEQLKAERALLAQAIEVLEKV